jgi:hypothetical protein
MSEQAKISLPAIKNRLTEGKLTQEDLKTIENSVVETGLAAKNLRAAISE